MLTSALGMLILGFGVIGLGRVGTGEVFVGIGVLYAGLALWMWESVPRRSWKSAVGIQEPVRVVFNEAGISATSAESQSSVSWRHYPYSKERSDFYLLQRSRRSVGRIVPKKGFASSADEKKFRSMLEAHTKADLVPSASLDDF
ncbi:MAG: YcxB family protein [Acidimicrobiales bacterium]